MALWCQYYDSNYIVQTFLALPFAGHYSAVTALALGPGGRSLLSGGRDKMVMHWCLRKFVKLADIPVFEAVEGEFLIPNPNFGSEVIQFFPHTESGACRRSGKGTKSPFGRSSEVAAAESFDSCVFRWAKHLKCKSWSQRPTPKPAKSEKNSRSNARVLSHTPESKFFLTLCPYLFLKCSKPEAVAPFTFTHPA